LPTRRAPLAAELQRKGLGARRTDLVGEKVDGTRQAIRAALGDDALKDGKQEVQASMEDDAAVRDSD